MLVLFVSLLLDVLVLRVWPVQLAADELSGAHRWAAAAEQSECSSAEAQELL